MTKFSIVAIFLTLVLIIGLTSQIFTVKNLEVFAHRDGCHRWHSCPSDTGSYVCGDKGYDDECPNKSGSKKEDGDESKSNNNSKDEDKSEKAKPKKVKTETSDEEEYCRR